MASFTVKFYLFNFVLSLVGLCLTLLNRSIVDKLKNYHNVEGIVTNIGYKRYMILSSYRYEHYAFIEWTPPDGIVSHNDTRTDHILVGTDSQVNYYYNDYTIGEKVNITFNACPLYPLDPELKELCIKTDDGTTITSPDIWKQLYRTRITISIFNICRILSSAGLLMHIIKAWIDGPTPT